MTEVLTVMVEKKTNWKLNAIVFLDREFLDSAAKGDLISMSKTYRSPIEKGRGDVVLKPCCGQSLLPGQTKWKN